MLSTSPACASRPSSSRHRMITLGKLFVSAIGGYVVGVAIGMALIHLLSNNRHDLATEAAMTSAFVVGPLVALIAMVVAWFAWVK